MDIQTRDQDGVTVVTLQEKEFDHSICTDFHRQINHLVETGHTKLLMDFSRVDFMDSCGIGTLITIRNHLMKLKGALGLCSISDRTKKIIDVAALHKILTLYDNVEEGVEAMKA